MGNNQSSVVNPQAPDDEQSSDDEQVSIIDNEQLSDDEQISIINDRLLNDNTINISIEERIVNIRKILLIEYNFNRMKLFRISNFEAIIILTTIILLIFFYNTEKNKFLKVFLIAYIIFIPIYRSISYWRITRRYNERYNNPFNDKISRCLFVITIISGILDINYFTHLGTGLVTLLKCSSRTSLCILTFIILIIHLFNIFYSLMNGIIIFFPSYLLNKTNQNIYDKIFSLISKLPLVKYKNDELEKCPICLENYTKDEQLIELNCTHKIHKFCIGEWLKYNTTCPLCRAIIEINI